MASPFVDEVFENWNLTMECAHVTDECAHCTAEKLVCRLATNPKPPKHHGGRVGEVNLLLEGELTIDTRTKIPQLAGVGRATVVRYGAVIVEVARCCCTMPPTGFEVWMRKPLK